MNRIPEGVRFFSSSITPLACISSVPRTAYHQCVALYITHATHGISSRLCLASLSVPTVRIISDKNNPHSVVFVFYAMGIISFYRKIFRFILPYSCKFLCTRLCQCSNKILLISHSTATLFRDILCS